LEPRQGRRGNVSVDEGAGDQVPATVIATNAADSFALSEIAIRPLGRSTSVAKSNGAERPTRKASPDGLRS
jgi:hypothetical protein